MSLTIIHDTVGWLGTYVIARPGDVVTSSNHVPHCGIIRYTGPGGLVYAFELIPGEKLNLKSVLMMVSTLTPNMHAEIERRWLEITKGYELLPDDDDGRDDT